MLIFWQCLQVPTLQRLQVSILWYLNVDPAFSFCSPIYIPCSILPFSSSLPNTVLRCGPILFFSSRPLVHPPVPSYLPITLHSTQLHLLHKRFSSHNRSIFVDSNWTLVVQTSNLFVLLSLLFIGYYPSNLLFPANFPLLPRKCQFEYRVQAGTFVCACFHFFLHKNNLWLFCSRLFLNSVNLKFPLDDGQFFLLLVVVMSPLSFCSIHHHRKYNIWLTILLKTSVWKVNGVNMKVEGSAGRWTRAAGAHNSSILIFTFTFYFYFYFFLFTFYFYFLNGVNMKAGRWTRGTGGTQFQHQGGRQLGGIYSHLLHIFVFHTASVFVFVLGTVLYLM